MKEFTLAVALVLLLPSFTAPATKAPQPPKEVSPDELWREYVYFRSQIVACTKAGRRAMADEARDHMQEASRRLGSQQPPAWVTAQGIDYSASCEPGKWPPRRW